MSTVDWQQTEGGLPQGNGPSGAAGWPAWVKLVIFLIILIALGWVLLLIAQYCRTGDRISDLPGVPPPVAGLFSDAAEYRGELSGVARPLGIAMGEDGRIYVTESAGERMVRVFDRSGKQVDAFAPPDSEILSRVPLYVAVSPKGDVYVSDRRARAIHIFSPDGDYRGVFTPKSVPAEEWQPMGLAFDEDGNLYVTDVTDKKHRVLVFDPSGELRLEFGTQGGEQGQFWFPNGITVDDRGRIYVADGDNGRLQVFDKAGKLLYVIPRGYASGDLSMPRGVALDGDGHLLVADTSAHTVKVYDVSGDRPDFLRDIGESGSGDGQFRFPNGVALADGQIYVTDRENGRVQIWSY
jgi:DNA-binding beta-propeller fold protein YncE